VKKFKQARVNGGSNYDSLKSLCRFNGEVTYDSLMPLPRGAGLGVPGAVSCRLAKPPTAGGHLASPQGW